MNRESCGIGLDYLALRRSTPLPPTGKGERVCARVFADIVAQVKEALCGAPVSGS